ncbi:MAG: carotenoid biosynthesis protein [Nitrospira sp.]|nr:carotenoid biosynthesis protein [Nitrospira sp.]
MEYVTLFFKTILFRPYVFVFLAAFLFAAIQLIGWPRTWRFWLISWATAFVCEYSSTRNGIPFGWYHYNGSTLGQELYFSNIPFMDSISFSFLLYAAYCVALCLLQPIDRTAAALPLRSLRLDINTRTSWRLWILTALLFAFIDMVIDPVALRGDRWFLGKIYYYPDPGWHFGVPFANYVGWAVVGLISLAIYFPLDRRLPALNSFPSAATTLTLLLGVGLYYGVLVFNLAMTFWIGESFMGLSGLLMHVPMLILLASRLVETSQRPVAS